MAKSKVRKYKYWIEIEEGELAVMAMPDAASVLAHIELNGASVIAQTQVDLRTHKMLQKYFRKGCCAVGISWNKHAVPHGFIPVKPRDDLGAAKEKAGATPARSPRVSAKGAGA